MDYDMIVSGGRVIDGTGNPWIKADVAVKGGRIAKVGNINEGLSSQIIDADGLVVTPGFIDIHTHSDLKLLINPLAESKIRQGVTTEVIGNCGSSLAPLNEETREEAMKRAGEEGKRVRWDWLSFGGFLRKMERIGTAVNVVPLAGNVPIRTMVMGFDKRKPRPSELGKMRTVTAQCMREGAFGLSTGLIYSPSGFAQTPEIIELCKVVAKYGGIYATHIRGEGETLIQAVKEAITIGAKAKVPVEIAHHKASGRKNWGKVQTSLKIIHEARERGIDVTCDVYPYTAGATGLSTAIPPWAHEGGIKRLLQRLREEDTRARIKREIKNGITGWENMFTQAGPENVLITNSEKNRRYQGKTIAQLARRKRMNPIEFVFDLLLEEDGNVGIVLFMMREEDMNRVLSDPISMIGSDASSMAPYGILGKGKPHPRAYGTFPRVLGRYVREKSQLNLPEAIRKMTSLPAQKLGLWDRGFIRVGAWADLVILDESKIADTATYADPNKYPKGIEYVVVNGRIVIRKQKHTKLLQGKVLRKNR